MSLLLVVQIRAMLCFTTVYRVDICMRRLCRRHSYSGLERVERLVRRLLLLRLLSMLLLLVLVLRWRRRMHSLVHCCLLRVRWPAALRYVWHHTLLSRRMLEHASTLCVRAPLIALASYPLDVLCVQLLLLLLLLAMKCCCLWYYFSLTRALLSRTHTAPRRIITAPAPSSRCCLQGQGSARRLLLHSLLLHLLLLWRLHFWYRLFSRGGGRFWRSLLRSFHLEQLDFFARMVILWLCMRGDVVFHLVFGGMIGLV